MLNCMVIACWKSIFIIFDGLNGNLETKTWFLHLYSLTILEGSFKKSRCYLITSDVVPRSLARTHALAHTQVRLTLTKYKLTIQ